MADDTYSRGYRNDPYDRGGSGAVGPGETDPLTELARLIGQSDPFSPDRNRQPDPRQAPPQPADWQADPAQHEQHYDPQHYDPQHYDSQQYDPQHYDHGRQDDRYAAGEPQQYADHGDGSADHHASYQNGYAYPQAGHPASAYGEAPIHAQQPYHQDEQAYQHDQPAHHQDQSGYHQDQPGYRQDPQSYPQQQPRYAQDHEAPYFAESDAPQHGAAATEPHGAVPGYPPPFLGSDPNERPDAYYEDAPTPRRGWLVTFAALVGVAVIGTAGAFAYRAVFTGGETRIITRDVQPSKITPTPTNQDASKPNERLASANQNEKLGPAPEQPMTIPEPPRTVPPALSPAPAPTPAVVPALPPATSGPAPAAAPADSGGPPRRVRTEKINPPQQQVGDLSGPRPGPPTQPRGPTAPPPAGPNAPLSLAPDAPPEAAPAPPPQQPQRHTTAVAPPPPAVERSSGGGSGYYVQVSAYKSEDEAKSSFRGISARHSGLLGGQQLVVRRKDLGSKGVWYGAQVGPFSREAAAKLCKDLEAAGQSCMAEKH
jgi:hypothetical protein